MHRLKSKINDEASKISHNYHLLNLTS